MRSTTLWALLTGVALIISACASGAVRVMPGPEGVHKVSVRAVEKHKAEVKAVKAATKYCQERGKEAIFLAEKTDYTGEMDESEREAIRKGSDAAAVVAGAVRATGSHDAAVIFDAASGVGRSMTSGKDYLAEVNFTCDSPD